MLTGTRRDKVKCLWYKNVGQELVEIKWNVYDIRMSIDFRLKLEKSFYSHPFFQNIYLSIIGSIRNGKSFYLLFENIHPLWYHSLQHDIKKLLFDTLKLLFKLFAWVFLEKQTLKLTLIIVNLESHAIDKKWKGEHPPSPLPPPPVTRPPLNPVSGKKNWRTLSSFLSCHRMFIITYCIFFEKNSETCLAFIFRRLKAIFKLSKSVVKLD